MTPNEEEWAETEARAHERIRHLLAGAHEASDETFLQLVVLHENGDPDLRNWRLWNETVAHQLQIRTLRALNRLIQTTGNA